MDNLAVLRDVPQPFANDRLLKIPEACAVLNISRAAFYKCPELKALIFNIGRASVVSHLAIQQWIAKKRNTISNAA